ncbi:MAG: hypothetical protein IKN55_02850 [Oscillospiraceae bacterium]|nr:hypothetical protein [Oscillospiraceae bacterium]
MKTIAYQQTNWTALEPLARDYYAELGNKNDAFHNHLVFGNTAYRITADGVLCGFFSLGISWDNGIMLCSFYLVPSERVYCVEIFRQIVKELHVQAAIPASNDDLFLSLAFERMHKVGTNFEMQAYHFTYGEPDRPAEFGADCIQPVPEEEYPEVDKLTKGQWAGSYGDPHYHFYKLVSDGETLGYGGIGRLRYNEQTADIGVFTLPPHRLHSVGRSLVIHLSRIALDQGLTPVTGCWYGNKESIPTLKSAGYRPENRLFYIRFMK